MLILLVSRSETIQITQKMLSQTRYIIRYTGCPMIWYIKLQIKVDLSTTEAKYIAFSLSPSLSQSTREVIPNILPMDKLKHLVDFYNPTP